MRNFLVLISLFVAAFAVGYTNPAGAAGLCGYVGIDCTTGQALPARIPSDPNKVGTADLASTLTGYATTTALASYQPTSGMTAYQTTAGMTAYVATTAIGAAGGVAGLDTASKVSTAALPDLSSTYVPWSNVEGTGTNTSTSTGKLVNAGDDRLTNARPPSGSVAVGSGLGLSTGSDTATATTAALSATPKISIVSVPESAVTFSDITTGNASASNHGYVPKLPADPAKYLNGAGAWSTPSGGGGGGLTTAYSVDFSTLASANLLTGGDGTKTVDGKTWTSAYSTNATTMFMNDGTHAGLYIKHGTTSTGMYAGNVENCPRLTAAISALTGSTEPHLLAETWVWFLVSTPHAPNANYEMGMVGVSAAPETLTSSGTFKHLVFQHVFSSTAYSQSAYNSGGTEQNISFDNTADVYVVRLVGNLWQAYYGTSSGGNFPARSSLTLIGQVAPMSVTNSMTAGLFVSTANRFALFVGACSGNAVGAADVLLKKLLIETR